MIELGSAPIPTAVMLGEGEQYIIEDMWTILD
jgi:hypothetical protein